MKVPENVKVFLTGFVGFTVMCALVFLAAILSGRTRPVRAQNDTLRTQIVALQYQVEHQNAVIKAYGDILHQVWLDKPTYVEECLTESNQFAVLDVLLNSEWDDIFLFRNEEDSISYYYNWDSETTCIHVVKHVVPEIPEPKSREK